MLGPAVSDTHGTAPTRPRGHLLRLLFMPYCLFRAEWIMPLRSPTHKGQQPKKVNLRRRSARVPPHLNMCECKRQNTGDRHRR